MASMGAGDKRLDGPKKVEYRLSQLLSGWKKADPAPSRVKPVPLSLLNHMYESAVGLDDTFSLAVADISYIGFFYICRPGETTEPSAADSRSSAFRLCDTEFTHGQRLLRTLRDALDVLALASAGALIFTDQKNAVRGEKHILGRSGHPFACPVLALLRRVKHLRAHNAPRRPPCTRSTPPPVSAMSDPPTSRHPSGPLPWRCLMSLALNLGTSPLPAYVPVAPWPSSLRVLPPTPSVWLPVGTAMPCSATSMSSASPSWSTYHEPWSLMAPSPCFPANTSLLPLRASSTTLPKRLNGNFNSTNTKTFLPAQFLCLPMSVPSIPTPFHLLAHIGLS
jgi:hypothetical protein